MLKLNYNKKIFILSIFLFFIFCITFPLKVKAEETYPSIYIKTNEKISLDNYVNATITFSDINTEIKTIENCEIKIRGNSTAEFFKSPYNIKLPEKMEIFGLPKGKKFCLLANHLDKTLIRNKLALDLANKTNLQYTPQSTFVDVYVNDLYMGNYLITQSIKIGTENVNINETINEVIIEKEMQREKKDVYYFNTPVYNYRFKFKDPEIPTEEQIKSLTNLLQKVEEAFESKDIEQMEKYIDIDSFIDYYLIQELFKNVDINVSSNIYYVKNNKLYAGPIWDFDLSSGNISKKFNNLYIDEDNISYKNTWCFDSEWAKEFLASNEIKIKMYQRYLELQKDIINLYKDNTLGKNQIDLLIEKNKESFNKNIELYPLEENTNSFYDRPMNKTYEENVEFLRNWLEERNLWLLSYMEENFNIKNIENNQQEITNIEQNNKISETKTETIINKIFSINKYTYITILGSTILLVSIIFFVIYKKTKK